MSNWYKREPSKFIGGVVGLGPDVIGAYSIILDLIYQNDGPVANDARYLGGILGCSSRKAASLIDRLIVAGKLFVNSDGEISNAKAEQVIGERQETHRERAESGAKGGRNSREAVAKQSRTDDEKNTAVNESNDLDQAELKHLDKNRKDKKDIQKGDGFEEWYLAYPKHVGKGQAEKAYRTALKIAEPLALLEGARRYAAQRAGQDAQFTAGPAAWLNGKRWLDEATAPPADQSQGDAYLKGIVSRYRGAA